MQRNNVHHDGGVEGVGWSWWSVSEGGLYPKSTGSADFYGLAPGFVCPLQSVSDSCAVVTL